METQEDRLNALHFIALTILVVAMFAALVWAMSSGSSINDDMCKGKYGESGFNYKWSPTASSCLIEVKPGVWIPEENWIYGK